MPLQKWFRSLSIRTQILFGISVFLTALFCIAIAIFIAINLGTVSALISDTHSILTDGVINKTSTIIDDKTVAFQNLIAQTVEGLLLMVGNTIKYTTKPEEYTLFPLISYQDNDLGDLSPPIGVIPRSGGQSVSLSASSLFVVGQLPDGSNIPALWGTHSDIINQTSYTDFYNKLLFQKYPDIVSVYYGDKSGIFRRYPGFSSKLQDPTRAYDPRTRPWYSNAQSLDDDVSITDPYLDAFGLGWMVTLSYRTSDIYGNFMGVIGADMLIDTIEHNINNFNLQNSASHLIQENGVVLSSPEWKPTLASAQQFMVKDISSPSIESKWDEIKTTENGDIETDEHIVIFKNIKIGDVYYYYVTTIPKNVALKTVFEHENSLKSEFARVNIIVVIILLSGLGVIILINIVTAHYMTSPIRETEKIVQRTGEALIAPEKNGSGLIAELTGELSKKSTSESQNMRHQTCETLRGQVTSMYAPEATGSVPQLQFGSYASPDVNTQSTLYPPSAPQQYNYHYAETTESHV